MQRKALDFTFAMVILLILVAGSAANQAALAQEVAAPVSDSDIEASQLLQPAELAKILRGAGDKPVVLQVGSHVLFAEAHIAGALYAGSAGQEAGLQQLRGTVANLPHDRFLVIYCGCCPWTNCPNIRPAYQALVELGFSKVKVLYLAVDFGTDWAAKGFPIEKGR